jgi:hypothetical protein
VGLSPTLGLAAVLGPVATTTTVETGVVMGCLAFPTATTSPFSIAAAAGAIGAAVTTLLAQILEMILG